MGITEVLQLLGGLALFLYGMQMMSTGLETAAGNKMKTILEKLTSNRIKGVIAGAIINRSYSVVFSNHSHGCGICKFRTYDS